MDTSNRRPNAAISSLLALARLGAADARPALLKALSAIPFSGFTPEQQLEKLRVIEVSIARQGVPTGEAAQQLIADVDPLFPAKTETADRELCQILLALNAPNAVARTVALLKSARTQEEQLATFFCLFIRWAHEFIVGLQLVEFCSRERTRRQSRAHHNPPTA